MKKFIGVIMTLIVYVPIWLCIYRYEELQQLFAIIIAAIGVVVIVGVWMIHACELMRGE